MVLKLKIDFVYSVILTNIEDEAHVLLHCPLYDDIRDEMIAKAVLIKDNFIDCTPNEKLCFILSNPGMVNASARACNLILKRRRSFLYDNA